MRVFVLCAVLLIGSLAAAALASTESRDFVARGAVDLSQDKFEAALRNFEAATKADPADSEAVFFQAVALNRLGRHDDALRQLDRAASMGYTHRDVALERGWALVGLRRWDEGIAQLNTFEASDPGRGQTSLLLGQAYRGKGDTAKAEAAFNDAMKRDPSLAPQASRLLRDLQGGQPEKFGTPQRGVAATVSPRGQSLRQQAGQAAAVEATTPADGAVVSAAPQVWENRARGAIGLSAGNNSNVISLGDATLAGEISQVSDSFVQMYADLSHDWQFNAKDGLTVGYFGQSNDYDDLTQFDLADHTAYVTYRHLYKPELQFTFTVADNYTFLGNADFRNVFSVRPAVSWLLDDGDALEFAAYYSANEYYFPTTSFFDRDGDTWSGALTHYFHIEDTRLTGRVGYYHLWNSTVGSDFDFESDGVILGLNHPIGRRGANLYFFYSHTWDDYDNPNSLVFFAFPREDESDRYSLQLSVPVRKQLAAFARAERIEVDSNVQAFSFDQDIYTGGVVASF